MIYPQRSQLYYIWNTKSHILGIYLISLQTSADTLM